MVTKKSLLQFIKLRDEAAYLHNSILKARDKLQKIENGGNVIDSVKGGDGGIQRYKIEGFPYPVYSRTKTRLQSDIVRLESVEAELLEQTNDVYDFIENMELSMDRMVFRLLFIDGLTQQAIANRLSIDQSTVSRTVDKYFSEK